VILCPEIIGDGSSGLAVASLAVCVRDRTVLLSDPCPGAELDGSTGIPSNGQENRNREERFTEEDEPSRGADGETREQETESSGGLSRNLRRWFS
jgi:hypothetical protein